MPTTIEGIETENFAWIDFFWSMMGRSGEAGEAVEKELFRKFSEIVDRSVYIRAPKTEIPIKEILLRIVTGITSPFA